MTTIQVRVFIEGYSGFRYTDEQFEDEFDLERRLRTWEETGYVWMRDAQSRVVAMIPWRRITSIEVVRLDSQEQPKEPAQPDPFPPPGYA